MKILNLEQFRALPPGTLFLKYNHRIFEHLQCKQETWEVDFLSENITCWPESQSSDDLADLLKYAEGGASIKLDFDSISRDGMFEDDQLFAVYEKEDIEGLMDKLRRCYEMTYIHDIAHEVDGYLEGDTNE